MMATEPEPATCPRCHHIEAQHRDNGCEEFRGAAGFCRCPNTAAQVREAAGKARRDIDRGSNTVEDAARFERDRAREIAIDDRPRGSEL